MALGLGHTAPYHNRASRIHMHAVSQMQHHAQDLVAIFDQCFCHSSRTRLLGGAQEPIYLPADAPEGCHRVYFTRDYFASALHEAAHWCIAGDRRRTLIDYGYWYAPDGRTAAQQSAFESVEVKPQALEWIFSEACAFRFYVSADNLSGALGASDEFKTKIANQARKYCTNGIAERPRKFITALAGYYGVTNPLNSDRYTPARLG